MNLGTITAGNILLQNANGSVNFLGSMSTTPQIGVLSTLFDKSFAIEDGADAFARGTSDGAASVGRDPGRNYLSLRAPNPDAIAVLQSKQYVISSPGASRIVTVIANMDPLGTIVGGILVALHRDVA